MRRIVRDKALLKAFIHESVLRRLTPPEKQGVHISATSEAKPATRLRRRRARGEPPALRLPRSPFSLG